MSATSMLDVLGSVKSVGTCVTLTLKHATQQTDCEMYTTLPSNYDR